MEKKSCLLSHLDVKAFTLIELLVVVLIIGILAAVALPQYQKAVEKSKAAQAMAMLKTVYNAAEVYYLANGTHAQSFDELAVDVPWTGTSRWFGGFLPVKSNNDWSVQLYWTTINTEPAVTVGRLQGKYKGAGFFMYLTDVPLDPAVLKAGRPYCMERIKSGVVNFSAEDGSYCEKILKGTLLNEGEGKNRYYALP